MTTQNIKLIKEHTHEGVKHAAGKELSVSLPDAEWMITVGVAELASPETTKTDQDSKPGKEAKK